ARCAQNLGNHALGALPLLGITGQLDDDLRPRADVARSGVGRENRLGEGVAVGKNQPSAVLLGKRADEPFLRALDDLGDAAAIHGLAVALLAVGDLGLDDVAGDGAAVFALGDEQVFARGGVGGDDESEA